MSYPIQLVASGGAKHVIQLDHRLRQVLLPLGNVTGNDFSETGTGEVVFNSSSPPLVEEALHSLSGLRLVLQNLQSFCALLRDHLESDV